MTRVMRGLLMYCKHEEEYMRLHKYMTASTTRSITWKVTLKITPDPESDRERDMLLEEIEEKAKSSGSLTVNGNIYEYQLTSELDREQFDANDEITDYGDWESGFDEVIPDMMDDVPAEETSSESPATPGPITS